MQQDDSFQERRKLPDGRPETWTTETTPAAAEARLDDRNSDSDNSKDKVRCRGPLPGISVPVTFRSFLSQIQGMRLLFYLFLPFSFLLSRKLCDTVLGRVPRRDSKDQSG